MEEKYKIHSFYVLLILASIIVALVTVEWAQIPELVSYLTFALTVSSLGLAVLAIIYSVFSNTTFAQNISTLENTARSLNTTSTKLSESTMELGQKLDEVPSVIKTVGDRVEETHQLISEMRSEKDQPNKQKANSPEQKPTSTQIDSFLRESSFNGLITIYMFCLSYQTGKPFNLEELSEELLMDYKYAHGYAVSVSAFGLLSYGSKEEYLVAKTVNDEVIKKINESIENKINDLGLSNPKMLDGLHEDKSKIEEYFSDS